MNKKIIVEYNLNLIQKIHVSVILAIGILIYFITRNINYTLKDTIELFTPLLLTFYILGMVAIIVSKLGLIINANNLYKGYFVFGLLIYKQPIDLKNKPIVSILKLQGAHGMPTVGLVAPQGVNNYYKFYTYLLDKSHTEKTELIGSKKLKNAELIVAFLTKNLNLDYELYNPNFDLKNSG